MSRIAGVVSDRGRGDPISLIGEMLMASRARPEWQSRVEFSDQGALGWCGWRAPNVACIDGVISVMDGGVYNRTELGNTRSDAELLLSLYIKHGFAEALRAVNGDFAVAVYDPRIATLWLGRDRFGIKPLYYVASPECVAFASRPRALFTVPGVSRQVSRRFVALFAASHYRTFDNDPAGSPYADIAQLPAAHMLRVTDGRVMVTPYWSLRDLPDFTESESELAARYRELLLDAVALRVNASHRPAFTLSGGLDSSSVLACAVRVTRAKQDAFSVLYEDATFDESREINSMLDATVARWYAVKVGDPDVFTLIARMVDSHDEPVATATWLSHFLLCQEAREFGIDGLFGGLGGDELNAGEYEYFTYFFADLRAAGRGTLLRQEASKWVEYHDHPRFRKTLPLMEEELARLVDWSHPGRCLPDWQRVRRYFAALNPEYLNLRDFEPDMDHPFSSYLKNRTYQDIVRETAPCCLRALDRQATAFDLDNFLPFFDHRLVEFMFRLPGTLKIRDGVTKHLLRTAMRGILPEETRTRIKKTGWNAPAHVWFSGAGRDRLLDLIHSQSFRERGIYNGEKVERLIDEHHRIVSSGEPKENHMMFLWQLVNLELWLRSI